MATWIPRKRFLQPIWSYQYDVVIAQSCLCPSVSSEHISTVCTGMIRPRIQRVPNTSLRLLLQGLRFSTSCPLCIWHQVCPRATSSTCWQQKPAQTRPMPNHTYSIRTRNNCKPEIVPVGRNWEGQCYSQEDNMYLRLSALSGLNSPMKK